MTSVMWFRKDLRIRDNMALQTACDTARRQGGGVRAVFIDTPGQYGLHGTSANQLQLMWASLLSVRDSLQSLGIPLDIVTCHSFAEVPETLALYKDQWQVTGLFAQAEPEWNERLRDKAVLEAGLPLSLLAHSTILPFGLVRNLAGSRYKVFTPYCHRWFEIAATHNLTPLPEPSPLPKALANQGVPLTAVKGGLLDVIEQSTNNAEQAEPRWPIGEDQAHMALETFVDDDLLGYDQNRDVPMCDGTSALSPYLALGVLSPRQCIAAVMARYPDLFVNAASAGRVWVRQLVWREFYHNLLFEVPRVARGGNYQTLGDNIVWRQAPNEFQAWAEGRTGYPLVDAAMRQLVQTGWMHNRLRMVAASFLSKHLLIDWRQGEAFFAAHLVDNDQASNNGGWQWSAGTGCDAQPYFRMFNPASQSQKFDPQAAFIHQFVPELAPVPAKAIHQMRNLRAMSKDQSYPDPIVPHAAARQRALSALSVLKKTATG